MRMREPLTVGLLAASNIGTAVANASWIESVQPYLSFAIGLGQVAVAVLTVWYIWKKIKNMPSKKK